MKMEQVKITVFLAAVSLLSLLVCFISAGCAKKLPSEPAVVFTATITIAPSGTATDTLTVTPTVTVTVTETAMDTDTITETATITPTITETLTLTYTDTFTATPTITITSTSTMVPRTVGGTGNDYAYGAAKCSDGGYIAAGSISSWGNGGDDVFLIKFNSDGGVPWYRNFGSFGCDKGYAVIQDQSGGFVIAGETLTIIPTSTDAYIIKTDSIGDLPQYAAFGGTGSEIFYSVAQTTDGGYIAAGKTDSYDGGLNRAYVVKMSSTLAFEWSRTIGGTGYTIANSVCLDAGGYAVAGTTNCLMPIGDYDVFLLRLNSAGEDVSFNTFGTVYGDTASSVTNTADGGFIIGATSQSIGGIYLIKTYADGSKQWEKILGGAMLGETGRVVQETGGGFVIFGDTYSYGAQNLDVLITKTDSLGNETGHKIFGGSAYEMGGSGAIGADGSYFMAGYTDSFGAGGIDSYYVKTDSNLNQEW